MYENVRTYKSEKGKWFTQIRNIHTIIHTKMFMETLYISKLGNSQDVQQENA
jgi:hypothetical protein